MEQQIRASIKYILSWLWVKQLLYWAILSAGTISECSFLIASIWMSINSSVHPFVLTLMSEKQSVQLSYIATTIYTALPELILSLALVTAINHCRNIRREKRYWYTWVWAALFGFPTVIFLFISIMTVASSVLKVNYVMPDWGIVSRALAGFSFAIVYLLYERIGKPCDASERQALEQTIIDLKAEMAQNKQHFETALQTVNTNFQSAMQSKQSDFDYRVNQILEQGKNKIEHLQNLIESQNEQVKRLSEKASSLERNGLENYPKVISELFDQGAKTVSVDTLSDLTGISKRRIANAKLQRHSRNRDLIMINNALIEWLQKQPLPTQVEDLNGYSNNHLNGDTDPLSFPIMEIIDAE